MRKKIIDFLNAIRIHYQLHGDTLLLGSARIHFQSGAITIIRPGKPERTIKEQALNLDRLLMLCEK